LHRTRPPWELVVIDNGSTDGTAAYLADVRDTAPLPVTVIANTKNLGFPAAINQGLECARGEYLVMLNNDAVVTEGWLEQLLGVASIRVTGGSGKGTNLRMFTTEFTENTESAEARQFKELKNEYPGRDITVIDLAPGSKIGLVGPMSNYAAPPQLVEDVPYRDLNEMEVFARRWRDDHRGKWMRVAKLSGFCLLMTRAVYDAVGGLDTRFGLGFFDDDDLAERARRAGFEMAVARDLFVHHFGSRTFMGNGIDANKLLEENAAKFAAKWGNSVPQGAQGGAAGLEGLGRGFLRGC
jgi:GT2 family glycosyltransferase